MMVRCVGMAALLLVAVSMACAQADSPLDGLSVLRDFRAMRASSTDANWQDGNGDARPIPPGQTLTLAELNGPGRIAHIWFTIADNENFYGKLLVLRMYWDGESSPSVEAPINDFFCQGHGLDVQVDSMPVRVTSNGRARNCYWSMPFGRSARITVSNEGKQPVNAFYYYIDWQKMDRLPTNAAYFHAQYRQEFPCVQGQDYLILDAAGRGQFVGCNLSIRNREPGWWGEGDDRFYIDGEEAPSLLGTGSEDYFCDAWGMRLLQGLYYGFPVAEGFDTLERSTCYRFHIQDPVPFRKSLRMVIEHKGSRALPDGKHVGYVERADDFSSVAYWYQTEPHRPFPPMPAAADRLYANETIAIEGESVVAGAMASEGKAVVQEMAGLSGGSQLFFTPQQHPASLRFEFEVPKAAPYRLLAWLTRSWDYGIYAVSLDGKPVGQPINLYAAQVAMGEAVKLGTHSLEAGRHTMEFSSNSKSPHSAGYFLGLDRVEFVNLAPD